MFFHFSEIQKLMFNESIFCFKVFVKVFASEVLVFLVVIVKCLILPSSLFKILFCLVSNFVGDANLARNRY